SQFGRRQAFSYPCPSVFIRGWNILVAARRATLYRRFLTCQLPPASNVLPITNRRYGAARPSRKQIVLVLLLLLDRSVSDYENEDDDEDERFARPATISTD